MPPKLDDRFALANDRRGTTGEIPDRDASEIDRQMPVNRRQKIFGPDAPCNGSFAAEIGGTDDLTRADSAASEQHGAGLRPMIAPGLDGSRRCTGNAWAAARDMRDARRAAELTCHNHQHAFVETALVDVFNQCRNGLIDKRSSVRQRVENVMVDGMVVPVGNAATERPVEFGGDDFHAGFDQPSREQALLTPLMSSVPISHRVGFAMEFKRLLGRRGRQQVHGLRLEPVDRIHHARLVDIAAHAIESRANVDPVSQPLFLHVVAQTNVGDVKFGTAGIAENLERFVRGSKISRAGNREVVVTIDRIDGDVIWNVPRPPGPKVIGDRHPIGIARHELVLSVGIARKHLQRTGRMPAAGVRQRPHERSTYQPSSPVAAAVRRSGCPECSYRSAKKARESPIRPRAWDQMFRDDWPPHGAKRESLPSAGRPLVLPPEREDETGLAGSDWKSPPSRLSAMYDDCTTAAVGSHAARDRAQREEVGDETPRWVFLEAGLSEAVSRRAGPSMTRVRSWLKTRCLSVPRPLFEQQTAATSSGRKPRCTYFRQLAHNPASVRGGADSPVRRPSGTNGPHDRSFRLPCPITAMPARSSAALTDNLSMALSFLCARVKLLLASAA